MRVVCALADERRELRAAAEARRKALLLEMRRAAHRERKKFAKMRRRELGVRRRPKTSCSAAKGVELALTPAGTASHGERRVPGCSYVEEPPGMRGAMQQADAREAARRRICGGATAVRDGFADMDDSGGYHVVKMHVLPISLPNGKIAMRVFFGMQQPFISATATSAFKSEAMMTQKRQALQEAHRKERATAERNAKKAHAAASA